MASRDVWLGLACVWWRELRRKSPVREALLVALAEHWHRVITDRLERNRAQGASPATYRELAQRLEIHEAHFFRQRTGKLQPGVMEFLMIAHELGVTLDTLTPRLDALVADAAWQLGEGKISRQEARAYAAYRLSAAPRAELDAELLPRVGRDLAARSIVLERNELVAAVQKTAEAVGARIAPLLRGRT